jgi:phosphatidylglycerophosphate synthase
VTEPGIPSASTTSGTKEPYLAIVRRLASAQKPAARSAPAYSRFVNRRFGRYLAAGAHRIGLGPDAVTLISAIWTLGAIALLILVPPAWWLGVVIAVCLLVGYAFDSADGQVARLQGTSSPAGEWLDHMVDATKVSTIPLAVLIAFYRFDLVDRGWLLIPLAFTVVSAVLFFGMILTEQLRRAHGSQSLAEDAPGRPSWLRAVLVIPMDYGLLCLSFVLLGAPVVFFVVYSLLFVATTAFLLLASAKWFRELRAWSGPSSDNTGSAS